MQYVVACRLILFLGSSALLLRAGAPLAALAADNPSQLTYQARLLNAAGTGALLDSNVTVRFQIYNPAGTCLLYEEQHTGIDTNATQGLVSLNVGAGTPTGANPGLSMRVIFSNAGSEIRASGSSGCAPGYTPAGGDSRRLRVTVTPNAGTPMTLSPDKTLASVPYAWSAETIQGLTPSSLIQATGNTSQATVGLLTNENGGGTDDASSLHHHDSLYARLNSNSSQNLGSGGIATTGAASVGSVGIGAQGTLGLGSFTDAEQTTLIGTLGAAQAGRTWYNSTSNQVMVWNGATAQPVATGSASQWTTGAAGVISYTGGNVGIGTTTPASTLTVNGDIRVSQALTFGGGWGQIRNVNNSSVMYFGSTFISSNLPFVMNGLGGSTFTIANSGPSGVAQLALTGGDVGVGTTTPAARLDVAGEAKVGNTGLACAAGTRGSIRYNTTSNVLEFCDGTAWQLVQASACSDATPTAFAFGNLASQALSTQVSSDIVQVSGFNCMLPATLSGPGSPAYRVCADSGCTSVVQDWTSSPASVASGQFLQLRLTTSAAGGDTRSATLILGTTASVWQVTPAGDCASSPAVGTVCADGSVYAGLSPDTNAPMYVTRCDLGQTWDGANCTGSRATYYWNNGTANYITTGVTNIHTGETNTAALVGLADIGAPYSAAIACDSLNAHGQTDWYLPARAELVVIYDGRTAIGNLSTAYSPPYWSSTETSGGGAASVNPVDGIQGTDTKNTLRLVRCARR
jgi:hypothetical protein